MDGGSMSRPGVIMSHSSRSLLTSQLDFNARQGRHHVIIRAHPYPLTTPQEEPGKPLRSAKTFTDKS